LIERFRKALKARGARGIIGLQRQFKIADDNGSGQLDLPEFTKAVSDFGVDIDPQDVKGLFKSLDIDGSGEINFDEFVRVVVGDMNQFRKSLVERAYRTLDINQDGQIDLDEFKNRYNAAMHPDVRSGKRTEDEVIIEFMETFEKHHAMMAEGKGGRGDGLVTLEEFQEYYNNISCNIENDSYFDLMISNAWNLEGGSNPAS
jgi:Ca2+-binding EF-hand superfamily protein